MSAVQTEVFDQLSATYSPGVIKKWEANLHAPNPYAELENSISLLFYFIVLAAEV